MDHSISGARVTEFLKNLPILLNQIRSDNGPELDSTAFTLFSEDVGIIHEIINQGRWNENANNKPFNSSFRAEYLNQHVFRNLE